MDNKNDEFKKFEEEYKKAAAQNKNEDSNDFFDFTKGFANLNPFLHGMFTTDKLDKDEKKEVKVQDKDFSIDYWGWIIILVIFSGIWSKDPRVDDIDKRLTKLEAKEEIIEKLIIQ